MTVLEGRKDLHGVVGPSQLEHFCLPYYHLAILTNYQPFVPKRHNMVVSSGWDEQFHWDRFPASSHSHRRWEGWDWFGLGCCHLVSMAWHGTRAGLCHASLCPLLALCLLLGQTGTGQMDILHCPPVLLLTLDKTDTGIPSYPSLFSLLQLHCVFLSSTAYPPPHPTTTRADLADIPLAPTILSPYIPLTFGIYISHETFPVGTLLLGSFWLCGGEGEGGGGGEGGGRVSMHALPCKWYNLGMCLHVCWHAFPSPTFYQPLHTFHCTHMPSFMRLSPCLPWHAPPFPTSFLTA